MIVVYSTSLHLFAHRQVPEAAHDALSLIGMSYNDLIQQSTYLPTHIQYHAADIAIAAAARAAPVVTGGSSYSDMLLFMTEFYA